MTTANITLVYPQGTIPTRLQANIKLTNINTKETIQSSDFSANTITLPLLKGVYNISFEGIISINTDGKNTTQSIRGYAESVVLTSDTSTTELNIIPIAQ